MENQKISEYGLASIVYKSIKQYEEDWKCIVQQKDSEIENLKKTIKDLTTELEEYRSIAENVGAAKAVSEKEKLEKIIKEIQGELPIWTSTVCAYTLENIPKRIKALVKEVEDRQKSYSEIMDLCEKEGRLREEYEKIINDTLRALPVGNINTHTPDTIPERVQDWVKEAAEECSLREKWEELADSLIVYAEEIKYSVKNEDWYERASKDIEQYEKLKNYEN